MSTFAVMASMAEKDRLRIAELEKELATAQAFAHQVVIERDKLREAALDCQRTVNTWRVIGFGNTGKKAFFSAIDKLTALLQESSDE